MIELKRSDTEKLIIAVSEFKGKHYLNIRTHFKSDDGEYLPTKKGVSIPVQDARKLLVKTVKMLRKQGHWEKT